MIQSTKASNAIEGIVITDKRLKVIISNKMEPLDRSEGEIAGYRDVLALIHASFEAIPLNSGVILQLHRDLYKYVAAEGYAGNMMIMSLVKGCQVVKNVFVSCL